MKTLFITSFHVLISRNILSTDAFQGLARDPEIRIVLFVPRKKLEYFSRAFGRPNVIVEGVDTKLRKPDLILRKLSLAALTSRTVWIKHRAEFAATLRRGRYLVKLGLERLLAGRSFARWALRVLDRFLAPHSSFDAYLERYRPSLVFSTDIQNEFDLALARGSCHHGIPVVGMVRSWDNLTAKGVLRLIPDVLAVNTEIVKAEAMRFNAVPAAKIRVVGIPHYDGYESAPPTPRENFFRSIGLDPQKRLVLVAPIGDRYICEFRKNCRNDADRYILETLIAAPARGELPQDLQLLVRLPPADVVNLDGFRPPSNMVIEQPGVGDPAGHIKEQELSPEDDRHLRDSLTHADLVITGPSTMAIDAALFDKPIVIPNFEPVERPYFASLSRFYDYDHFRPIIESGGARVARSPDELVTAVRAYLKDPGADRARRKRIVEEQVWRTDGKSSERLLQVLYEYLQ